MNDNLWLHRYMSYERLKDWIEDRKFVLRFSRMDQLDDPLEGWEIDPPEILQIIVRTLRYYNRVIQNNGQFEGQKNLIKEQIRLALIPNYKNISVDDIYSKLLEYRNVLLNHHVSCWFMSNSQETEERYMWDLYAKSKSENNCIILSIRWSDLIESLEDIKGVTSDKIDYIPNSKKPIIFRKHKSYQHEKEYIIIHNEMSGIYNGIMLEKEFFKYITINESFSNSKKTELENNIDPKYFIIRRSKLTPQIRLSDIKHIIKD